MQAGAILLALQTPASPDATGTLAFTTGNITFAGSGLETETGTLAFTTGGITFAGSGLVTETGTLAFTTAGITFAGNGSVTSASADGTLAFTTGGITFSGSGTEAEIGTLSFTTDGVQFAGSGLVTETGALAFTTDSIAFAGSGTETITGALGTTLDSIQFAGSGNVVTSDVDGVLACTTDPIGFSGAGSVSSTQPAYQATPGYKMYHPKREETKDEKRIRREAQGIIARAKVVEPEQEDQLFKDAVDVIDQLKLEVSRLEIKAEKFSLENRHAEMIRAQLAQEQLQAQIEEIDSAFVMFTLLAQID